MHDWFGWKFNVCGFFLAHAFFFTLAEVCNITWKFEFFTRTAQRFIFHAHYSMHFGNHTLDYNILSIQYVEMEFVHVFLTVNFSYLSTLRWFYDLALDFWLRHLDFRMDEAEGRAPTKKTDERNEFRSVPMHFLTNFQRIHNFIV